ncbi:PREDICTED: proline-rich protein 29, partial [Merops nubicus]|uniref:proline-rich protein 29 n=1 Tax=Merops nubicus TaxID=57421 RepID=UPI0004F088E9
LMELLMIQNSQLHQVLMSSLALSALAAFGFGPSPPAAQALAVPPQPGEEEEAVVCHHHYVPCPAPAPVLAWQVPAGGQRPVAVRHLGTESLPEGGEGAVPPPPPPSATGTVGADVPPASEYYDMVQGRL